MNCMIGDWLAILYHCTFRVGMKKRGSLWYVNKCDSSSWLMTMLVSIPALYSRGLMTYILLCQDLWEEK